MLRISHIQGREILDSRGTPALEVELSLGGEPLVRAAVPSGSSTGSYEALELRDGDSQRFQGKGLLKSLAHIRDLAQKLKNKNICNQEELDAFLIKEDGTKNKSRLGANTTLGISLAYAKARASAQNKELFQSFKNHILPVPLINILNGGVHANNGLSVQEFMIVPYGFNSFKRALQAATEVFHVLKSLLREKNLSVAVGDEGGFAPQISNNEEALKFLLQAIKKAGYSPEKQIALALDVAASEFSKEGLYYWEDQKLRAADLIRIYEDWSARYPLISIEDGLAEDDWEGWALLTSKLGKKIQLMGDDLFVTDVKRLQQGVDQKVANSLLVKINQVGTLTETHSAICLAQQSGYTYCVSHRSGETEDTSIVDLSIAWSAEQIKTGSVCRGERVVKYNRFLRIEELLKDKVSFSGKRAFPYLEV